MSFLQYYTLILSAVIVVCHNYGEILDGEQVWKVQVRSDKEINKLKNILVEPFVEIERQRKNNEYQEIYFRVEKKYISRVGARLRAHRFTHDVIVLDVKKQLEIEDAENRRGRPKRSLRYSPMTEETEPEFDYTIYHSLYEIEEWMDQMVNKYSFVRKIKIGDSYENRSLHALIISTDENNPKPVLYMDAAIHAREWIAPAVLMYVCNQILTNASYAHLLRQLDYYLVPVVNVDGYAYSWFAPQTRLWRKTRKPYMRKPPFPICVGVDGNRNWDVNFGGPGAAKRRCSIVYHGPYAESEPVIYHLAEFIRMEKQNIKGLLSLHSYGQQILYPYNYKKKKSAPNEAELKRIGANMSAAIKSVHGKDYESGRGAVVLYVFSGSTSDWAYEKAGISLSYTLELRDTGRFHFELPADQIIPTGEEIMAGVEVVANAIIEKYGSKGNQTSQCEKAA